MPQGELIVQGDVEWCLCDLLLEQSEITDYSPSFQVKTDLKGYTKDSRYIHVKLNGGTWVYPKPSKPRVDFEVYAESRSVAQEAAQKALAVIFREAGSYTARGVRLGWPLVETGIFRVPDKDTESPRYVFSLRLTIRPA